MKARKIKLRFAPASLTAKPRNPVAVALSTRRGGEHRKANKAVRRAANAALKPPVSGE